MHTQRHTPICVCLYMYGNLWQDSPEAGYGGELWGGEIIAREQSEGGLLFSILPFECLNTELCAYSTFLLKNERKK